MFRPVLEKFLSCNEVEVFVIGNTEFSLRKISTKQAEYLNRYYEYFKENPEEFLPFLRSLVIDIKKLETFLLNPNTGDYDNEKLLSFIHAVCIQATNLRPASLDYTLSNTINEMLDNSTVINRFIGVLVFYGYKKSEIDEFSNNKIIRLCLEEMWIRDKSDCILFIAEFVKMLPEDVLPLSNITMEKVIETAENLKFSDETKKQEFLNKLYNLTSSTTKENDKPVSKKQFVKTKSTKEIIEEAKAKMNNGKDEKSMFNNLPR